jgi:hypothetical protein
MTRGRRCYKFSGYFVRFIVLLLLLHERGMSRVNGNYLSEPEFVWSIPITTSSTTATTTFQKGNAVTAINSNGLLAITSSAGSLHIVSSNDVSMNATTATTSAINVTRSYTPTLTNTNMDTTTCQSGIITALQSTDGSYIVIYAVTDTDSTSPSPPTSRILAVNSTSAALVWNVVVPGTIVGTPILSLKKDTMYVVHNIIPSVDSGPSQSSSSSSSSSGQVSIYEFNANGNIFSTSRLNKITTVPSTLTDRPFGPAALKINPVDGREYLFFAESSDDVFEETFTDSLFAVTKNEAGEYVFLLVTSAISSTNTAPTIRNNNEEQLDFFLGQPGSTVFGWVGTAAVDLLDGLSDSTQSGNTFIAPSWQITSQQDQNDNSARTYQ